MTRRRRRRRGRRRGGRRGVCARALLLIRPTAAAVATMLPAFFLLCLCVCVGEWGGGEGRMVWVMGIHWLAFLMISEPQAFGLALIKTYTQQQHQNHNTDTKLQGITATTTRA